MCGNLTILSVGNVEKVEKQWWTKKSLEVIFILSRCRLSDLVGGVYLSGIWSLFAALQ